MTEIETYLLDEIEVRQQIAKKLKRFNTITGIAGTGLITSTVITGGTSIAVFASGVALPVEIVYFFPLQQSSHKNRLKPLP